VGLIPHALPLAVTNDIRHQPACDQLLGLSRGSWDFSCSVREIAAERLIFDRSDQHKSNHPQTRSHMPLGSSPQRTFQANGGRWGLILGHLLAVLRAMQNISALRPSFIHSVIAAYIR
jgi:hypothetical protein